MNKPANIHEGRNIKRFREMLGIKQEALAFELGDDWTQKKISQLEAKEAIEPGTLDQVAKVLKVPTDAIKNFDEQNAINIISNTFNDQAINMNYQCTINPIEKWQEAIEENKKLAMENKQLYERLLQSEQEKVAMLEKVIEKLK